MTLAIASPSSSTYSETFIRMQMEQLPCKLRIHGGPVAEETYPGGEIKPLKNLRGIIETAIEYGLGSKLRNGPQSKELGRRLRRAKIDTLLANYGPTGVALLPVCRANKIKLIVHFHGYDAHTHSVIHKYREHYRQLGVEATAVIAVSEHMVDTLTGYDIPRSKINLLRCGADAKKFSIKQEFPKDPLFLCVGRFVDKKAPYLTLLSFKEVHRLYPRAKLVMCGDGPLLDTTRNLCLALGLDDAVVFPGPVPSSQIATWMQAATAFVQHSITPKWGEFAGDSEGTPVAVLEAMVTGLPVISTRHAGIGEVINHGHTGLLVEERDVEGMAQAMLTLSRDAEMVSRLGAAAREYALSQWTDRSYLASLKQILEMSAEAL